MLLLLLLRKECEMSRSLPGRVGGREETGRRSRDVSDVGAPPPGGTWPGIDVVKFHSFRGIF